MASSSRALSCVVVLLCAVFAHASSGEGASRKLLQLDPSVCPYELGFTPCFSADGSSLNCILDSCTSGSVVIPGSPPNQPQAVRDGGNVLINFFTAIGNSDYNLYKVAVAQFSAYIPDHQNSPNIFSNGRQAVVFNALQAKLAIPPGSDFHSIFKVTDASIGLVHGVVGGVGFTVNYPSVNPTLTFHFNLGVTSAGTFSIVEFYYTPYGAPN